MPDNCNYPALEWACNRPIQGQDRHSRPAADGDYVVPPLDVFAPRQFHGQGFVHRGDGRKSKVPRLFTAGKRAARIRRSTMR